MAPHHHGFHQLSLLLNGGLRERQDQRQVDVDQPALGFKPAGAKHANHYGEHGALILTMNLDPTSDWLSANGARPDWRWSAQGCRPALALGRRLLQRVRGSAEIDIEQTLIDIVAMWPPATDGRQAAKRAWPDWLRHVHQQLHEAPETRLGDLSAGVGLHPVHVSRTFARLIGCPLSVYRARLRLARGLNELLSGVSIADAALGAGFADQAHFTRAARRDCGLTPGQLSGLLNARG